MVGKGLATIFWWFIILIYWILVDFYLKILPIKDVCSRVFFWFWWRICLAEGRSLAGCWAGLENWARSSSDWWLVASVINNHFARFDSHLTEPLIKSKRAKAQQIIIICLNSLKRLLRFASNSFLSLNW